MVQNGVYIESENVDYLEGGAVLQTSDQCLDSPDGTCVPARDSFGGANYFDRETQIMHVVSLVVACTCVFAAHELVASWVTW